MQICKTLVFEVKLKETINSCIVILDFELRIINNFFYVSLLLPSSIADKSYTFLFFSSSMFCKFYDIYFVSRYKRRNHALGPHISTNKSVQKENKKANTLNHCESARARKVNKRNGLHNASNNFQDHSFFSSNSPYCIVCGYRESVMNELIIVSNSSCMYYYTHRHIHPTLFGCALVVGNVRS